MQPAGRLRIANHWRTCAGHGSRSGSHVVGERAAARVAYTQLKILNAPFSGSAEISVDLISSWKRSVAI